MELRALIFAIGAMALSQMAGAESGHDHDAFRFAETTPASRETAACLRPETLSPQQANLCHYFCTTSVVRSTANGRDSETKYLLSRTLSSDEPTSYFKDLFSESRQLSAADGNTLGGIFKRENDELVKFDNAVVAYVKKLSDNAAAKKASAKLIDVDIQKLHALAKAQAGIGQRGAWTDAQFLEHSKLDSQKSKLERDAFKLLGEAAQYKKHQLAAEFRTEKLGGAPLGWRKDESLPSAYTLETTNGNVTFEFAKDDFSNPEPMRIFISTSNGIPQLACDNSTNHILDEKSRVQDPPTFETETYRTWLGLNADQDLENQPEPDLLKASMQDPGSKRLCEWVKARNPTSEDEVAALHFELSKSVFTNLNNQRHSLHEWLSRRPTMSVANSTGYGTDFDSIELPPNELEHQPPLAVAHTLSDAIPDHKKDLKIHPAEYLWSDSFSKTMTDLMKISFPANLMLESQIQNLFTAMSDVFENCIDESLKQNPRARQIKVDSLASFQKHAAFQEFANRASRLLSAKEIDPVAQSKLYEPFAADFKPDKYKDINYGLGLGVSR